MCVCVCVCVCVGVCVFQVGIVSYGETVTHSVNLSQFHNTPDLLKFVEELPQQTGIKTMTFLGIDTARYSTLTPPPHLDEPGNARPQFSIQSSWSGKV